MNLDTYTSFIPTLKAATGHDILTKGITTFDFTINEHGTKKLCTDDKLVLETEENFEGKTCSIKVHSHPTQMHSSCRSNMPLQNGWQDSSATQPCLPSPVFLRDNPNVYCKPIVYDMSPEKEQTQQQDSPESSLMEEQVKINNIEPMNTPASPGG